MVQIRGLVSSRAGGLMMTLGEYAGPSFPRGRTRRARRMYHLPRHSMLPSPWFHPHIQENLEDIISIDSECEHQYKYKREYKCKCEFE